MILWFKEGNVIPGGFLKSILTWDLSAWISSHDFSIQALAQCLGSRPAVSIVGVIHTSNDPVSFVTCKVPHFIKNPFGDGWKYTQSAKEEILYCEHGLRNVWDISEYTAIYQMRGKNEPWSMR